MEPQKTKKGICNRKHGIKKLATTKKENIEIKSRGQKKIRIPVQTKNKFKSEKKLGEMYQEKTKSMI